MGITGCGYTFIHHFQHFLVRCHLHCIWSWFSYLAKNFQNNWKDRWPPTRVWFHYHSLTRQETWQCRCIVTLTLPCGWDCDGEDVTVAVAQLTSGEHLGKMQLEDSTVGLVLKAKVNDRRPAEAEVSRQLYQLWNQLVIRDNTIIVNTRSLVTKWEGTRAHWVGEEKTVAHTRVLLLARVPQYLEIGTTPCSSCAQRKTTVPKNKAPFHVKVGSLLQLFARILLVPSLNQVQGTTTFLWQVITSPMDGSIICYSKPRSMF